MTAEEIREIMEQDLPRCEDSNKALLGLQILAKYTDDAVAGAEHDVIYSEDIEVFAKAGITPEECKRLRELDWHLSDDQFARYV